MLSIMQAAKVKGDSFASIIQSVSKYAGVKCSATTATSSECGAQFGVCFALILSVLSQSDGLFVCLFIYNTT